MKTVKHSIRRDLPVCLCLAFAALTVLGGCENPPRVRRTVSRTIARPTQIDLLVSTYPDLEGGRFVTIADFENPRHLEIVRMKRATAAAGFRLDPQRGRRETGGTGLAFTVGAGDALIIDNASAERWYMRRDWSGYDLLVMSISSPLPSLTAELTITAGPTSERFTTTTSIPLDVGWNLIRLDLAGMGERIPLGNVQEIRLAVSGALEPVTLLLDDIILTANRKTLLGDPTDGEGGLYARHVGRRWKIGSRRPGAFDLTFSNGQIVQWFNLAADPGRRRNLVWGTTLGPTFVSRTGRRIAPVVSVKSRIVELSPVRVVIASQWFSARDGPRASGIEAKSPSLEWIYTIYPSGQLYVTVKVLDSSVLQTATGLAVSVSASSEGDLQANMTKRPKGNRPSTLPTYASARMTSSDALLLYTVSDVAGTLRIEQLTQGIGESSATSDQTSFNAYLPLDAPGKARWDSHLFLASSSQVGDAEVLARAFGYARPILPHLELGTFVSVDDRDGATSGFDPGQGCFVIAPERGQVRLILDGTQQPYFSPAFRITNSARRDARVYVDHLIFNHAALDADGNVVFQLPFTVDRRVMVEVLFP